MQSKNQQSPLQQQPRSGKSLIEMMTVIAIISVLIPIGAKLMWTIMQQSQSSETALVTSSNLSRLSHQFHQDAHAATSAKANPQQPGKLTFTLSKDQTIQYLSKQGQLIRIVQQDEKTTAQEIFRLPHQAGKFQLSQANRLVTLTLQSQNNLHAKTPVAALNSVWNLKATIGRNHRFNTSAKEDE